MNVGYDLCPTNLARPENVVKNVKEKYHGRLERNGF